MHESFFIELFHDFGLDDAITRALAEEKHDTPSPIQAQTIPAVMSGRDVIGIAQTGSGNLLPILHRLAATALAIGGIWMGAQVRALLNREDVLVAKPGRLLDLAQRQTLKVSATMPHSRQQITKPTRTRARGLS